MNEPPTTQDPFNRKGSRGRSGFDIRHNFVANVVYELPFGRGSQFGGWQISAIANVHSNVPFTPVLAFDNADLQSLLTSERPDLVGNPYHGYLSKRLQSGYSVMLVQSELPFGYQLPVSLVLLDAISCAAQLSRNSIWPTKGLPIDGGHETYVWSGSLQSVQSAEFCSTEQHAKPAHSGRERRRRVQGCSG